MSFGGLGEGSRCRSLSSVGCQVPFKNPGMADERAGVRQPPCPPPRPRSDCGRPLGATREQNLAVAMKAWPPVKGC